MMTRSFLGRAMIAAFAFTAACGGDSTGPAIQLTEDQLDDMMEAFASTGGFFVPVGGSGFVAKAVVTVEDEVPCPNGGTATVNGTINENEQAGTGSITVTQGFSNCKATSESTGRVWTFNGDPSITTTMSMSTNQQTGLATLNGSIKGAIKAASDIGSGRCVFDVTITASFNDNTGAGSSSITGSVCGRNFTVEVDDPGEV